jgi:hypothetical protein
LQFFVQVLNLTNHPNDAGYSGTLTSPFFGLPTTVSGMRKVDAGTNISFQLFVICDSRFVIVAASNNHESRIRNHE